MPVTVSTVHPRACGEHSAHAETSTIAHGSSPRLRGTHWCAKSAPSVTRFIPAPAGNTRLQRGSAPWPSVHPRACGEHSAGSIWKYPRSGSSPRLRGTPPLAVEHGVIRRFIPAPAGNTAQKPTSPGSGVRFIPAPAGNTGFTHVGGRIAAVHPRACGEHNRAGSSTSATGGSSPRLRGTLLSEVGNCPSLQVVILPKFWVFARFYEHFAQLLSL